MIVLPAWEQQLSKVVPPIQTENLFAIPRSPIHYAAGIQEVRTATQAQALLQLAMERPLSHIGFDFEYGYARLPVKRRKSECYDISSIVPYLLTLTMVEPTASGETLYRFVVFLDDMELLPALAGLFRLPVTFVGHYLKGDLFCLWSLGLPEPSILWDTWVCEKALNLGRHHIKYKVHSRHNVVAEIEARESVELTERLKYSLAATCRRYGIELANAGRKSELQRSFLTHQHGDEFTAEQIDYAVEDSVAVARVYPQQLLSAASTGVLSHLVSVEMAWTTTVARMEQVGLKVDVDLADKVRSICQEKLALLEQQVKEYGLDNVSSNPQVREFFKRARLLHLFAGSDGEKFEKRLLMRHADRHPAIRLISECRQLRSVLADGMLDPVLVGGDGCYHPEHRQLGTHTGRQTSKNPNALGLPGSLRPLVIAEDGYGIGEVDLRQIEVGITAAVYGDGSLIEMFNAGDVYIGQAKQFYSEKLTEAELSMDDAAFKKAHTEKRNVMKTVTLAMIYGVGLKGLASQLGVKSSVAMKIMDRFRAMFPVLTKAKTCMANTASRRGYATTVSGLRRYRGRNGSPSGWEWRWLVNFPVQGSAAVAFKMAGNRLDRIYQAYGARLLLPMHDAFVFEAPMPVLAEVAELTARVMCEAVQELFPQLRPQAEINIKFPGRWNKDGDLSILERRVI